ncbi:MAG: cupin domain-containing protein [Pseudomonadota bacterium]|nr:cupin domain-containing protein [Pseudomonadota bacterium]
MRDSVHPVKIPSMLVKRLHDCSELEANDGCQVRELLHPKNDPVSLPFSLAICTAAPGAKTYVHRLAQAEVYYILRGLGRAHVGHEIAEVGADDAVLIPAGESQWIENIGDGDLVFAAIVSALVCGR